MLIRSQDEMIIMDADMMYVLKDEGVYEIRAMRYHGTTAYKVAEYPTKKQAYDALTQVQGQCNSQGRVIEFPRAEMDKEIQNRIADMQKSKRGDFEWSF